ncbi:MAG: hypothetical protein SOW14_07500 [Agathobacter sp.]|nr:hypothetical protein [Lachnospiraceae bacterium]MDY2620448.1 hypothetical protein [Agathobacter sp.]
MPLKTVSVVLYQQRIAHSTQVLVSDMDKISHKMDENFAIADGLRKETSVFTKL